MRLLDQATMQRLFTVTDEIPLDREAIEVPLELGGDGGVERLAGGRIRITLPDEAALDRFLEELPGRIANLPP